MNHLKNLHHEISIFKQRIIKASLIVLLLSLLLLANLFKIQILKHPHYHDLALQNQLQTLPIPANRGLIYDRKNLLIAENIPRYRLIISTSDFKKLPQILPELTKLIVFSPAELKRLAKLRTTKEHLEIIPIKDNLSREETAIFYVNQYRFPELKLEAILTRYYPEAAAVAHVLGYLGRANNLAVAMPENGKTGVEKFYDHLLCGKTGTKKVKIGAAGKIIETVSIVPPKHGNNLYLTIDTELQRVTSEAFAGESGAAVAIDPRNGEILALVSQPSFDPNLLMNGTDNDALSALNRDPQKPLYNRATKGIYPFGSTIKPFIALSALDEEIITPDWIVEDSGIFQYGKQHHLYRDWNWRTGGHGSVNVIKALIVSCDVFFYSLAANKLTIDGLTNGLTNFGFGKKTSIDLPEEFSGRVATPAWKKQAIDQPWYTGDTILSSIGQGFMTTTIMQLANATAILANHGKRVVPHLLRAIQSTDGDYLPTETANLPPLQLKHPKFWKLVTKAMQQVVMSPKGTAYLRYGGNYPYTIAGKTGEAQLFRRKNLEQKQTDLKKSLRNHNLFIAFAPLENPKIAVAVISEHSNRAIAIARRMIDYWLLDNQE